MKLLLPCLITTALCLTAYGQESRIRENPSKKLGFSLQGGVRFKDHKALSQLLYGSENHLKTGVYYNSAIEMQAAFNRVYAVVGLNVAYHEKEISGSDFLEIEDDYGYFSIGYAIRPKPKLEILPNLGISYCESNVSFTRDTNSFATVQNYLNGQTDTYKLLMKRLYARFALQATYKIDWFEDSPFPRFLPLELGLNAEFLQAINSSKWQKVNRKELAGPDVFPNSLYVGFVMGWWF